MERINAMTTKSLNLDQDGGSEARAFGTTGGDVGRKAAEHRSEQASQDAKSNAMAADVARNATGSVPKPIGR